MPTIDMEDNINIHDQNDNQTDTKIIEKKKFLKDANAPSDPSEFNSYSMKKNIATGLFNVALLTSNFINLKKLIVANKWSPIHMVAITVICILLILQFAVAALTVFLGKNSVLDENQKIQNSAHNDVVTLCVSVITILNIAVHVLMDT